MSFEQLFETYRPVPRAPELGRSVLTSSSKGLRGVLWTLAASLVLGVPLSFVRFRRSLPWEPLHMVWGGLSIAVFVVPIALVVFFVLRAYVRIFREGRLVEGVVVETRGAGAIVRVAVGAGPDMSFVPGLRAPAGERVPMLLGDVTSSKALCVRGVGDLQRCSLLTAQQISQVAGA